MTAGLVLYFGDMLACTILKVSAILPTVIYMSSSTNCLYVHFISDDIVQTGDWILKLI